MRRFGPALLVLVLGSLATILSFMALRAAEIGDAQKQFASRCGELTDLVQKEADAHLQVLGGVRAFFESSEFVSAKEFEHYTARFLRRYPHMYSLAWLPIVARSERAKFEADASKQLGIEYRIREPDEHNELHIAAERDRYVPVYYSQARDDRTRLGFDTLSRPAYVTAQEKTARLNQPTAVRIEVKNPGEPPAQRVLVYLPVSDVSPESGVAGFVRSSISAQEMLAGTLRDAARNGIAAKMRDPTNGSEVATTAYDDPSAAPANRSPLRWQGRVQIADLPLTIDFGSTDAYPAYPRLVPIYLLLAAGLAVSLFGAAAVFQLTRRAQRLKESETRYRVLIENNPDAILLHREGRVTFANGACARIFGVATPEAMLGRSVFDLVTPESHELVRSRLTAMLETRKALPPVEHVLVRADGSTIDVEILAVPFETEEGVVIQVTARDITRRKVAEAERQKLEDALRQSQKMEALGTLAGGIAHDFNNILSAIIGNTRLLLDDIPQSHHASRSVREILTAAHRARDLVKRIASFSRQQESSRVPIAVVPLLREVQELMRATLPAGIELVFDAPPETPWILGDATQIHQILMNLCTNAWQAMPRGEGRIDITVSAQTADEVRRQSRTPLTDAANEYVCIGVHDTGSGIPASILDHIFEPFFTTKQPGEGSGLGLAVVHGILRNHEGAIAVRARPPVGTSFLVYLPAAEMPVDRAAPATPERREPGKKQHILYVDDEGQLVYLVVRMLERAGFRCTGQRQVEQALELVRDGPESFDLVVTDLSMPGMNGLEFAREVLGIRADMPIIVMTGYVRSDVVAAAKELGVRDVVLKPDTIEELASLVQTELGRIATGATR